ncbi:MAG: hypothetical protein JXA20_10205 [Spirochaetes bacterium]|nr:hypothetical protein [Spirochaetota bacterium]
MKAGIRKVIVAVGRRDSERVIYELGRAGIVHIGAWETAGQAGGEGRGIDAPAVRSLLARIESLAAEIGSSPPGAEEGAPAARDPASDLAQMDAMAAALENRRVQGRARREEIASLRERRAEAMDAAALAAELPRLQGMELLDCLAGYYDADGGVPEIDPGFPFYLRAAGNLLLAVGPRGGRKALAAAVGRCGFRELAEYREPLQGVVDELEGRIADLEERERRDEALFREQRRGFARDLAALERHYGTLLLTLEARENLYHTEETVLLTGWIDVAEAGALMSVLERTCGTGFYVKVFTRREMAGLQGVPVRLRNNRFFRAFERLVKNAGIPSSLELDPTPVATIAYLLMFGVMFGDLGQGLVLALTGGILKFLARKRGPGDFLREAGTILIAGGISASLFGILYGSVFSNEHLLPALWFNPMENMADLFFAAILMGAAFILTGIVLNMVNLLRESRYLEALMGARGLPSLAVYAGSLFFAVRYLQTGRGPVAAELHLALTLPVCLFLCRGLIGGLVTRSGSYFHGGVVEYTVESVVEVVEMFSGFLGNTISFIRAGAFALSHAGLSIAVYTLAAIVGPGITVASVAVIVVGNVFIILLEGLVCGIQAMRLEYYEFFRRFFQGGGIEFAPFSLRRARS